MVCDVTFDEILSNSIVETLLSVVLFTPGNASNISRTETIFGQASRHGPLKMLEETQEKGR